jgi:hypothetical protein
VWSQTIENIRKVELQIGGMSAFWGDAVIVTANLPDLELETSRAQDGVLRLAMKVKRRQPKRSGR